MMSESVCNCGHRRNFHRYGPFGNSRCKAQCATVDDEWIDNMIEHSTLEDGKRIIGAHLIPGHIIFTYGNPP